MKHLNIRIYGRVQGVGFRFLSMQKAYQLSVTGLVRNMDDGSVYIEAEGTEENVGRFSDWCRIGPLGARIDRIEAEEGNLKNFESFDIDHY